MINSSCLVLNGLKWGSIYNGWWKLAVSSCLIQFLSNSINRSVHTVYHTTQAIGLIITEIDRSSQLGQSNTKILSTVPDQSKLAVCQFQCFQKCFLLKYLTYEFSLFYKSSMNFKTRSKAILEHLKTFLLWKTTLMHECIIVFNTLSHAYVQALI